MKRTFGVITLTACGMVILILDTKTALTGASDGLSLCLSTLIPSLFPFIFLSKMLISALLGRKIPFLSPLRRILKIQDGAESLFLIGLLGGYPIGAQCVSQAFRAHAISRKNAERMLRFCSNAGPAFLFGIGTRLFADIRMCWTVWAIHILSSVVLAIMTPGECNESVNMDKVSPISLTAVLYASIQTMALICGWVIVFRIILAFCQRWFLWALPQLVQYLFAGVLELSNGCCVLALVPDENIRLILFAAFLGFGGLCVVMQTQSVCEGLNICPYLFGKLSQTAISVLLTTATVYSEFRIQSLIFLCCACCLYYFYNKKAHKCIAFSARRVYNEENTYAR